MDKLSQKILAEFENIEEILNEMPLYTKLPFLSSLELAGVAAYLHSFYNGIENILKQIFISKNLTVSNGHSWHKELLEKAVLNEIITEKCKLTLGQYLAFRHYFSHAYSLDLFPERMATLVENSKTVFDEFKNEIRKYL